MFFTFLKCVIIIFYTNLVMVKSDLYADRDSLINLAENISVMFENVLRLPTLEENEFFYPNERRMAMTPIVEEMKLLDQSIINLDYLDDAIMNEESCMQFKNLINIKNSSFQFVKKIDAEYKKLKILVTRSSDEPIVKTEYIDSSENPEIAQWSDQVRDLIVDIDKNATNNDSFLHDVERILECRRKDRCLKHIPPPLNYVIFRIYLALVSSLLKAFAVIVLGCQNRYIVYTHMSKEDSKNEISKLLTKVKKDLILVHESMENYWAFPSSISLRNCPAKKLIRDDTFIELERVFQLVIIPEYNIIYGNLCSKGCESVYGPTWGRLITNGDYTAECQGVIKNCENRNWSTILFCDTSSHDLGVHRYRWIQRSQKDNPDGSPILPDVRGVSVCSTNGANKSGKCARRELRMNSNSRNLSHPGDCGYCVCTCEENTHYSHKSTFIISSELASADVLNDMVITGVKFVKSDKIVYTKIQQGKLLPGGSINSTSIHWKPIQHLDQTELDIEKENRVFYGNYNTSSNFILISSELKYVNLDKHRCPSEQDVVTGIGLEVIEFSTSNHRIALMINCHRVDLKTGEVLRMNSTLVRAKQFHTNQLDIGELPPNKVCEGNFEDTSDGKFVEFKMSHPVKDAGQSVIPWFDAQEVNSSLSTPFAGVELYHRGRKNSGGFLAYGLIPIDYSRWI